MVLEAKTEKEFDDFLAANKVVIVDFSATWCGPCKMISPVFVQLAEKNKEIGFLKVDVDTNAKIAQRLGIRAMPTFKVFVDGKEQKEHEIMGANKGKLESLVAELVKAHSA
mmetsp:Transcript_636/g.1233  ORF Transcript_636/g.1233 Transcript_636/m.1233 type:complete len:111 (-) Transcript_636:218-550(-)|eukprot:CAMPEP_0183349668 /NCGR_PEP_ID=MMETSP0164_2-20130417/13777_1 /TAXON_ID=221442 /ORGANISM="Coccolithus pelagicus ssp braarudi, Strain PLY182g" /LENGTH=110 /DNA_ID=CAMNT_0025521425 /DNA_START=63 /DNA_END=395 /DNA_ORIENTATION=-